MNRTSDYRWLAVVGIAVCWTSGGSAAHAGGRDYSHKSDIVKKAERIEDDAKVKRELEQLQTAELEARQKELENSTQEDRAANIRD